MMAHVRHVVMGCGVMWCVVGSGCERPGGEPAVVTALTAGSGQDARGEERNPDEAAEEDVTGESGSLEDQMLASRGQACKVDDECAGYLRCMGAVCAVPGAITGDSTAQTPKGVFFGEKNSKEPVSTFWLELATDDDQRARGLMFRRSMKPDWGMLFVYPQEKPLSFWMKNTYLPLDMVFIRADGEVAGVLEAVTPLTLEPRSVGIPSRYVLELGSGVAAKRGVVAGGRFELENSPQPGWAPQGP